MEVQRNLNVMLNYYHELEREKMENAIYDAMPIMVIEFSYGIL